MDFDFNDNVQVESLDKVPEQFRGAYVENTEGEDGGFVINPAVKPLTDAVAGLNGALAKARKEAKGRKVITPEEVLEPTGFKSVEEISSTIDTLKEQLEKASEGKVDPQKIKAELQKTFDLELQKKDQSLETMAGSLHRYLVEREAVQAISQQKGVTDLLLPHIKSQAKVIQEGDDFVVRIVDADGDARGDGKGGFMSVADLVVELKAHPSFGRAFESETPRGSGTPPGGQPPRVPNQGGRELTATEKIAAGLRKQSR